MTREYRDYLEDILTSMKEAVEFTRSMTFDEFDLDRKTSNAVIRSLEILGEAAKRVPDELRQQAPNLPWKYMMGMRNKLIHEYFAVDLSIVWEVVRTELPPLIPQMEMLLDGLSKEE